MLNKAFLLLQDLGSSDFLVDRSWVLLTSSTLPAEAPKPTALPLEGLGSRNNFACLSFDEISASIRSKEEIFKELNMTNSNWVISTRKG